MADLKSEIFEYAERLYEKAVQFMNNQSFRMADIHAICAYSVAVFVASDKVGSQELRDKAGELEQAAWVLSMQAHAAERGRMIEPRMQGSYEDYQELEAVRYNITAIAKDVFHRRRKK